MTAATDHAAARLFRTAFGSSPAGLFSAPGRVNLIGEHTDYNSGLVLPFAIDARAEIAAAPNADGLLRIVSAQRPGPPIEVAVSSLAPRSVPGWAGYVAGAVWSLQQSAYPMGGFDVALDSSVPVGAGLSSSAAVECASVVAATRLSGLELVGEEVARIAQRDENDFVGVPCGLMDQMASSVCRPGHALFFDVGASSIEHIPFDPAAAGLTALLIDTRAHHSLADGEYGKRRASCEQAAAELQLRSLRDIEDLDDALARLSDDVLRRRVRHVVTENSRVRRVVDSLSAGRIGDIGGDMLASHASLRDDFEVSCAELDAAVDAAVSGGAIGARMTGGGFGGSVIALVPADQVAGVGARVADAFRARSFSAPILREVAPAAGARVDWQA